MEQIKKTILIKGMHCRSCEILVEESLKELKGVTEVAVNQKRGIAEISSTKPLEDSAIAKKIKDAGYLVVTKDTAEADANADTEIKSETATSFISTSQNEWLELIVAGLLVFSVSIFAKSLGLFNISINAHGDFSSLPIVLLVGLTAGISTCMALVGGLVLSVSARYSELNPNLAPTKKLTPHLLFNLGRIIFFGIFGGIIGLFGSIIQFSATAIGFMTLLVGGVMLILGLQTTKMFPILNKISFTLPKKLYKLLGISDRVTGSYSNKSTFVLGALTFFLPCGFTQAMQLFAVSSGSALTGALTMSVFALGTAPGLLGLGGLASMINGRASKFFFKFVGVVVVALALFNISNGANLTGISSAVSPKLPQQEEVKGQKAEDQNVTMENGVQVVKMTQNYSGYTPNSFTIKKDLPVKWVINSTNAFTCASSLTIPQLNIRKNLVEGENVINFTATKVGALRFSCIMGMYNGSFNVI